MVLSRKFARAEDNDYERLAAAGGRLRALAEAFAEDRLPPEYTAGRLAAYAASLMKTQRDDGSFSASRTPEELEPDVRTDAHRFVTWVSASFLNLLGLRHPDEASGLEGLDEAVAAALNSPPAADFSFPESGPAEPVQQVEAALVLSSGGIPALLRDDPALAPDLAAALRVLAADFRRRLQEKDTVLPGGIDYTELFARALAALEA